MTAEAVKPGPSYVIDPWTVGMTYPDVNIASGQSIQFVWPGAIRPIAHTHITALQLPLPFKRH